MTGKYRSMSALMTKPSGISQGDLYQILSCAMVLPSDSEQKVRLFLVYPEHEDFTKIQKYTYCLAGGKELSLCIIPLNLPIR